VEFKYKLGKKITSFDSPGAPDKLDFKRKTVTRDEEGHCILFILMMLIV